MICRCERFSLATPTRAGVRSNPLFSRGSLNRQEIASSLLAKRGVPRNDIKKKFNYAILTIFQKSVKPIGFHSKPETVFRTPNSAAGWYRTA